MYAEQRGSDDIERRIADWVTDGIDGNGSPRRARLPLVGAAAATVIAVAAGGVVVARSDHGSRPVARVGSSSASVLSGTAASTGASTTAVPSEPVSSDPLSSTPTSSTPTSSTPTRPDPAAPMVTITPQVIAAKLLHLMPGSGQASSFAGDQVVLHGNLVIPNYLERNGSFDWNDGYGTAVMSADLTFPPPGRKPVKAGWLCRYVNPVGSSRCVTRPDGSQLFTETFQPKGNAYGYRDVRLLRTDGVEIDVTSGNGTSKSGSAGRSEPTLSIAQLTTIASSPTWTTSVARAEARRDAHLFKPTQD